MLVREHLKTNFLLAYPVMLSQLGHVVVGVADSVMVGQLGPDPLAAASLANAFFYLLLMFGIGVSYAITPFVAAGDGEGDKNMISSILKHGTLINLVTAILLTALVVVATWGLPYLDQPEVVVGLAIPYLKIISISIIPLMLFQSARQFAEGLSHTRQAMYISVATNLLNIFLNYLLIFGKFGFPAMGLVGAGVATLIARSFMAVGMWLIVIISPRFKEYILLSKEIRWDMQTIRKMLRIGVPAGVQFIFEVSAFGAASIMIGWIGAKQLAAHQIAINMASVSYMMASGLSAAATIRVGNQFGRKDIKTMREAGFTIFFMVAVFMVSFAFIFILGRFFFPSFYINDSEVTGTAASLVVIAALFQISDGIQVVGLGALRGLADVKIPTLITFIAYWVVGLPCGYLLGFKFGLGVQGIWYGLLLGLSMAAVLLFYRFSSSTRRMLTARK